MLVKRIDACRPDPKQPRKVFATNELQMLADNMRQVGQLQPILLAPDGTIIAGQRRWLAAQLAGMQTINAIVVDATEAKTRLIQLAENLAKESLKDSEVVDGVEEAILLNPEMPGKQLAETVNLLPSELSKVRAIIGCPVARAALSDGRLGSFNEAYAVARAAPEAKAGLIAMKAAGAKSHEITAAKPKPAEQPAAPPGGPKPRRVCIPISKDKSVTVTAAVESVDGLIVLLTESLEIVRKSVRDNLSLNTAVRAWSDKAAKAPKPAKGAGT